MVGTMQAVLVGLRPYKFQRNGSTVEGHTGVLLSTDGSGETVELGVPREQEDSLLKELQAAETHQLPVVARVKVTQTKEPIGDTGRFRKVNRLKALELTLV